MLSRIEEGQAAGYPFLVGHFGNEIVGYAYGRRFRPRFAYLHSIEVSVYVKHGNRGQQIGTLLYQALLSEIRQKDFHAVIGGISLPNDASVRLHERFGFEKVAHFREVGRKFGRWIDAGADWQLPNDPRRRNQNGVVYDIYCPRTRGTGGRKNPPASPASPPPARERPPGAALAEDPPARHHGPIIFPIPTFSANRLPRLFPADGTLISPGGPSPGWSFDARTADGNVFYWLGFDIATGIFGDPGGVLRYTTIFGFPQTRAPLSSPPQGGCCTAHTPPAAGFPPAVRGGGPPPPQNPPPPPPRADPLPNSSPPPGSSTQIKKRKISPPEAPPPPGPPPPGGIITLPSST